MKIPLPHETRTWTYMDTITRLAASNIELIEWRAHLVDVCGVERVKAEEWSLRVERLAWFFDTVPSQLPETLECMTALYGPKPMPTDLAQQEGAERRSTLAALVAWNDPELNTLKSSAGPAVSPAPGRTSG